MELSAGIQASLAGRYASALFELASEGGVVSAVESDLETLSEALRESAELRALIRNPEVSREALGRVLSGLGDTLALSELTRNFLGVLAQNRRDRPERADHRGQLADAAVLRQHAEEVAGQLGQRERVAEAGEHPAERFAAHFGIIDERAQFGRFAQRLGQLVEIGFDRRDGTRLAGEVEQGRCVTPG